MPPAVMPGLVMSMPMTTSTRTCMSIPELGW